MALADVFFTKSDEMLEAERILRDREDEYMAIDPRELTECPVHAQADARRLGVVLGRLRVSQTTSERNADRNLIATIFTGAVVAAAVKAPDIVQWVLAHI